MCHIGPKPINRKKQALFVLLVLMFSFPSLPAMLSVRVYFSVQLFALLKRLSIKLIFITEKIHQDKNAFKSPKQFQCPLPFPIRSKIKIYRHLFFKVMQFWLDAYSIHKNTYLKLAPTLTKGNWAFFSSESKPNWAQRYSFKQEFTCILENSSPVHMPDNPKYVGYIHQP